MLSALVVLAAAVGTAAPVTLAAPALANAGLPPDKMEFFTERIAQALAVPGLKVITARDIATVLGLERQKQLLGCASDGNSCIGELGNALGAKGILNGSLARID